MKLKNLFLGDIKFQVKYGFYFIYLIFTLLYIVSLTILPADWIKETSWILIFTDPSIMGLVFMGAIVQLEISEKTFNSLAVAPIKSSEYLLSKLLSLAFLSLVVSLILGIYAGSVSNYLTFIIGILMGSIIFSSIGLILAFKSKSLNQFILYIIPIMLLIILPGIFYIFGKDNPWLILHPGIAIVAMISSKGSFVLSLISLTIWLGITYYLAFKMVNKNLKKICGEK
ncbi:MAG: ABC transporter permease [Bacilli bacterium]|nr:ABC transporter permease [Bacilli bacterium]